MLLSIIIPVCNEAEILPALVARLRPVARGLDWDYELIFVNDGSTDKTGKILEGMVARDRRVKVMSFSRNFGHQAAITAGLDFANGDAVAVMDGDMQDPPELLPEMLGLLRGFFDGCPGTRLHLHFEAISGPWERLFDDAADLILHHVDKSDPRLDFIALFTGELIPVVAPNFLPFPISDAITPEQMRGHVQCVIRDTARHSPPRDYYLVAGAHSWTVSDQLMKKEIILQGMGWGHMPGFLIADELRDGRLLSIQGKHLRGGSGEIVAARRRDRPHGPMANRLWRHIEDQAPVLAAAIGERTA